MNDEAVDLTDEEAEVLAMRIAVQHLSAGEWLWWENVPLLSEASFVRLSKAADDLVADLWRALGRTEQSLDIDSAFVLGRSS